MMFTLAIFTIRSVTSMMKAISQPTPTALAQVAYDIFHFLFRDRILDLQTIFPADKRIVDKHGVDKGPFWGEKKRYPTVAVFDVNDESHQSFIVSTMCLVGVAIGAIPVKEEGDDQWCAEYRRPEYLKSLLPSLTVPTYIFSPVNTSDSTEEIAQDDAQGSATSADGGLKKEELLSDLLAQLNNVSKTIPAMPSLTYTEFEKDDDYNFHISFVTSTANLRCDNYSIKRTNFHSCKVIAGKIIAAIATTTAAVCGLVILELFKLLLQKPTESYMNRQIGLATSIFTSFTAESPAKLITKRDKAEPEDAAPEMYDDQGRVKSEYLVETVKKVCPEGHTVSATNTSTAGHLYKCIHYLSCWHLYA